MTRFNSRHIILYMAKPETTRIALDTVGCKLNQAETQHLAWQFAQAGYRLVPPDDGADIYVLNTCTVTHVADGKCRRLLNQARRRNPGVLVVAIGCYAQRARRELSEVKGVDLVLDNQQKLDLLPRLEESGRLNHPAPEAESAHAGFRTRAFIKVQDGCNNFCAYCIVPLVRGREKSRPLDQVLDEVSRRVAGGYKEVVLTGTEIGSYNYKGTDLPGLLRRVLDDTGVARLRLSSLQPQEITP